MTAPADLVLTNAAVHTLTHPDEVHEAVAVRDGEIVRLDSAYEVGFLEGVDTTVVDLGGRVVLPGFVDAHTHLEAVGRRRLHADLSVAGSREHAVDLLRAAAGESETNGAEREWILGYGYDESTWADPRYLTSEDLDAVSRERPVAAFREDMHVASLNDVALARLMAEMPDDDVHNEGGEPTGVVVEGATEVVYRATAPGPAGTRELLLAGQERATELGITAIHDMARRSHKPRVYRDLDAAGELALRVRINYWADHLEAVIEAGLRTGHGSDLVRTGAIKTYTDGSIGGRTAKLRAPYIDVPAAAATAGGGGRGGRDVENGGPDGDGEGTGDSDTGQTDQTGRWVVDPGELRRIVERADEAGLQVAVHAIGDEAIRETLAAFEERTDDPAAARHRVEHAEVLTGDLVERFAATGAIASVQPNFLKWAREDGLYERRLGPERTRLSNRYRDLLDAGVTVAFGSDCMPLDPLFGVQQAVTAPHDGQRLSVTEALRAYTRGGAFAAFDEARIGTLEVGKRADLVALESSPWAVDPEAIADVAVALTILDGTITFAGD